MGRSFTTAAGPRQRSHSRVRVPWDSWPCSTVSESRFPQPGGPGPGIYSPQKQGGPVIPSGTGCPFRCLLRLAGLRWRYSNPPPHGITVDCCSPGVLVKARTASVPASQSLPCNVPTWYNINYSPLPPISSVFKSSPPPIPYNGIIEFICAESNRSVFISIAPINHVDIQDSVLILFCVSLYLLQPSCFCQNSS
jgi:hypothetical protein